MDDYPQEPPKHDVLWSTPTRQRQLLNARSRGGRRGRARNGASKGPNSPRGRCESTEVASWADEANALAAQLEKLSSRAAPWSKLCAPSRSACVGTESWREKLPFETCLQEQFAHRVYAGSLVQELEAFTQEAGAAEEMNQEITERERASRESLSLAEQASAEACRSLEAVADAEQRLEALESEASASAKLLQRREAGMEALFCPLHRAEEREAAAARVARKELNQATKRYDRQCNVPAAEQRLAEEESRALHAKEECEQLRKSAESLEVTVAAGSTNSKITSLKQRVEQIERDCLVYSEAAAKGEVPVLAMAHESNRKLLVQVREARAVSDELSRSHTALAAEVSDLSTRRNELAQQAAENFARTALSESGSESSAELLEGVLKASEEAKEETRRVTKQVEEVNDRYMNVLREMTELDHPGTFMTRCLVGPRCPKRYSAQQRLANSS